MTELSDYKRLVSDPLEASLRAEVAALSQSNRRLREALTELVEIRGDTDIAKNSAWARARAALSEKP